MPLLRQSLYSQNVNLYLAPTADGRDTWLPLMRTVASEGRCVVLSANQCISRDDLPEWIRGNYKDVPQRPKTGGNFGADITHHSEPRLSHTAEGSRPGSSHGTRRKSIIIEDGNEVILPDIPNGHGKHHGDQHLYIPNRPSSSHSAAVVEEEDPVSSDIHPHDGNTRSGLPTRRRSVVTTDGNEIALPGHGGNISTTKSGIENGRSVSSDLISRGGSCIISPSGEVKAGPLWDDKDGLLVVDMDFEDCLRGRLDLDVAGSYSRYACSDHQIRISIDISKERCIQAYRRRFGSQSSALKNYQLLSW